MSFPDLSTLTSRTQHYLHCHWKQLAELAICLAVLIPLFFLPSLQNLFPGTGWWHLNYFATVTGWNYNIIYILWVIILGGIFAGALLLRHRILLYAYLTLAAFRLISLFVPIFWHLAPPGVQYVANHILIYPLRPVIGLVALWAILASTQSQQNEDPHLTEQRRLNSRGEKAPWQ